jgi:putative addiction module component (TIGR02574 family)
MLFLSTGCAILGKAADQFGGCFMSVNIEALGIDRLSVRERLDLIEQIWNSLPEQVNPDELPAWHRAELAKRRAEADASPGTGKPWREALARFGGAS